MVRTLYFQLVGAMVGLFCLIGLFFLLLSLYASRLYSQEVNQTLNRDLAPHLLSERILMQNGRINDPVVKHVFHQLMVVNPGIEVYLLDTKGNILTYSAPAGRVKRNSVSLAPVRKFLAGTVHFPILGDDPRAPGQQKVFSVTPVPLTGPIEGYLYVILGGEEVESISQLLQGSYIFRLSLFLGAGAIFFALLTSLLLFHRMTRPLRKLTRAMESFRQSDFSGPPARLDRSRVDSGNEIDRLSAIFGQMSDRIVSQIQELRKTDELRREFIANVTHDIRTPLTSLKGYLETLQIKEKDFSSEEQALYLGIAIKHSKQLEHLVYDLFELSKLEAPDAAPHFEAFPIVEQVHDIIQKFQVAADSKGIAIHLEAGETLPLVHADIALVERVFDNLIENALRFTAAGGSILVELVPEEGRILLKVSDTGTGMGAEELSRLFDRSHQLHKVRRKDDEGSGLGLSIAKRILELHGSELNVQSAENAGTVFTFSLPVIPAASRPGKTSADAPAS